MSFHLIANKAGESINHWKSFCTRYFDSSHGYPRVSGERSLSCTLFAKEKDKASVWNEESPSFLFPYLNAIDNTFNSQNKLEKFVLAKLLVYDCLFLLISKFVWLYSTHVGFVIKVVKNIFEIQNLKSATSL